MDDMERLVQYREEIQKFEETERKVTGALNFLGGILVGIIATMVILGFSHPVV